MDKRAFFLDRDGVINQSLVVNGKPYAPTTLEDFVFLDGVKEAFAILRKLNFSIVIFTNQPDLKTGKISRETFNRMTAKLETELAPDAIKVCEHVDSDSCLCRKPKPGMILEACADLHINPTKSYVVGDRWRDIDAAYAAGCKSFFIDWGYNETLKSRPDFFVSSLLEAALTVQSLNEGTSCET